jgi:transposase-like protein
LTEGSILNTPDASLRRQQGCLGNTWYLDELFVNIHGRQHYLWRAIDHDGDVIDISGTPGAIVTRPNASSASY